jgi:hypothetical protein
VNQNTGREHGGKVVPYTVATDIDGLPADPKAEIPRAGTAHHP